MAKRFSDTDKWKKSFFRGLQAPYKLLWMYVLDDCDIAGVWQVDIEVAALRIGEKVKIDKALELFGDRVLPFDHGKKWFIADFIFFQYSELSTTNRMHQAVLKILASNNLDFPPLKKEPQGASEGLPSPQGHGQGHYQGEGQGEGKGQGQGQEREPKISKPKADVVMPFESFRFREVWATWITYRREIKKPYRSPMSEQAALKNLSKYDEVTAIAMIENSIANQWQGIFELKHNGKRNSKDDIQRSFAESITRTLNGSDEPK